MKSKGKRPLLLTLALTLTVLPCSRADALGMRVRGSTTELRLVRHDVSVQVEHPLAVLRITQEFENPLSRAVEADYSYRLPPGATVDDLGLWVNGVRRPARMLERQRAKEIYEGIVRQKRDPALVERTASGLYRVRIFPVLPRQRTRIELRYTQLVAHLGQGAHQVLLHHQGRVPLRISGGLGAAGSARSVRIRGYVVTPQRQGERWTFERRASAQETTGPVILEYRLDPALPQALVQRRGAKRYLIAAFPTRAIEQESLSTAILLDTSKSMTPHWRRSRRLVEAIAAELPSRGKTLLIPLHLAPSVKSVTEFEQLSPTGGSALMPAFDRARSLAMRHLILITDSPRSSYQAEIEYLARRAYDHNHGSSQTNLRISVVQVAKSKGARSSLEHLAKATGGIFRMAPDGVAADPELAAALCQPRALVARMVKGAQAHVLHQGAARLVISAEIAPGAPATLRVGASELALEPRDVAHGPATLWGAAEIQTLQQRIRLFGEEEALRRRIVALSKELRIASEYTALLVTEKDADYDRPTSGRVWQRKVHRMGQGVPAPMNYHATPEPHEWAMIALALAMIFASRRPRWRGIFGRARGGA